MSEIIESHTFTFKINKKQNQFTINHNLKEYGLDICTGFESWLFRTKEFTRKSFVEYLKDKLPEAKIY